MSFFSNLFKKRPTLDPEMFGDNVAFKTNWHPLKHGGSNFKTHKLVFEENGDVSFKPSLGIYLGPIILVGFAVTFFAVIWNNGAFENSKFPLLFAIIPFGLGFYMLFINLKHRVFSPVNGVYYRGKKPKSGDTVSDKNYALLADIHALQLIRERVRSSKSSYTSYELNLVLKNGHRVNVVDHGNLNSIRNDTKKLAEFLQVPVWDAIDNRV